VIAEKEAGQTQTENKKGIMMTKKYPDRVFNKTNSNLYKQLNEWAIEKRKEGWDEETIVNTIGQFEQEKE
jgi:hypothetical protein